MKFNFLNQTFNVKIWTPEIGILGRYVAVDTETTIKPFYMTPDLVTIQAYSGGSDVYFIDKESVGDFFSLHSSSYFLFINAPFDMDVLRSRIGDIYSIYDDARIRDIGVLYRLVHLAALGHVPFKFNLALLSEKFLGQKLEKDERRENFSQFLNTPIKEIPEEYLEYGAKDVIATYKIYFALMPEVQRHDKFKTLLSHDIQVKGDLALLHIHKNGIGFDLKKRDAWLVEVDKEMNKNRNILATYGWVRGKKGIKDVYERTIKVLGLDELLPRTESGEISSKTEHLEPFSNNGFIKALLEYRSLEKARSFVEIDNARVHPRYNLLVNTGRTSCSKPNFQQLPKFGGVREMFVAEEGNTFIITDYSAIELATLAQVCYARYSHSEMRDKINDGIDLHSYYGTVYYGKNIEDITKEERQTCKAPNFGFPGGLGVDTFIEFSRGYGLEITQGQAQAMKNAWFGAFPEMDSYMQNEVGEVFTLTGRKRGNTTYCAEKNTPFQGLAADGAKIALYNLDKAGLKIVGFCHDEIVTEVSKERAKETVKEQEQIMIESMEEVVPDVRIGVESQISSFYTK